MHLYLVERKTFTQSFFEYLLLAFMSMAMPKPVTGKEDRITMSCLHQWWFVSGSEEGLPFLPTGENKVQNKSGGEEGVSVG